MTSAQIETLENARFDRDNAGYPYLEVEVNGRPCRVFREKALRVDGQYAALDYGKFQDFYVLIPMSQLNEDDEAEGFYKLHGYTTDPRYVSLVWKFVDAVDGRTKFVPGPVEIPR